jgi:hypothetical protein
MFSLCATSCFTRAVARPLLPERVVRRDDKTGFPVPYREWIAAQVAPQVRALLRSEASLDRGIFHPRVLRDPQLSAEEILSILNIEVCFRVFIYRDPAWLSAEPGAGRAAFAGLPPLPAYVPAPTGRAARSPLAGILAELLRCVSGRVYAFRLVGHRHVSTRRNDGRMSHIVCGKGT